jgi:hypothetical protein
MGGDGDFLERLLRELDGQSGVSAYRRVYATCASCGRENLDGSLWVTRGEHAFCPTCRDDGTMARWSLAAWADELHDEAEERHRKDDQEVAATIAQIESQESGVPKLLRRLFRTTFRTTVKQVEAGRDEAYSRFVALHGGEDNLVSVVQSHARLVHGIELSRVDARILLEGWRRYGVVRNMSVGEYLDQVYRNV